MVNSLDPVLDAAGARRGTRGGLATVTDFGSVAAEHAALRSACGLLDGRLRAFARVVGDDRTRFLQGMLSNDVAALASGGGIHAAMLTVQGRVVTDLRVYGLDDEIWLDFPAHRRDDALATLGRYVVADDVEFVEPEVVPLVALEGPEAAAVLQRGFACEANALAPFAHAACALDGAAGRVFAVHHAGQGGFLLAGPEALAPQVWDRACAAGARPVGADALAIARVEAGIPLAGVDMDEDNLAPEVGLADAISFRKGCYIGQEVVERVAARGNVQRRLVGLRIDGDEPVPAGSALVAEGREAGHVTSCVVSPLQGVIALAYARRAVWDPGAAVDVVVDGAPRRATVAALPFAPPPR